MITSRETWAKGRRRRSKGNRRALVERDGERAAAHQIDANEMQESPLPGMQSESEAAREIYRVLAPLSARPGDPADVHRGLAREMYRTLFATERGLDYLAKSVVLSIQSAVGRVEMRRSLGASGPTRHPLLEVVAMFFDRLPAMEVQTIVQHDAYSGRRVLNVALMPWGRAAGISVPVLGMPVVLRNLVVAFMSGGLAKEHNAGGQYLCVSGFLNQEQMQAVYNPALFAGLVLVAACGDDDSTGPFAQELLPLLQEPPGFFSAEAQEDARAMVLCLCEHKTVAERVAALEALRARRLAQTGGPQLRELQMWGSGYAPKSLAAPQAQSEK